MSTAETAPASPILDLARPLAERQLARLERLAEIGMAMAEKLNERMEAAGPQDDLSGVTMAFNRVSRAVRVTDMLQTRVLTDLDRQLREATHRAEQAEAHDQRLAEDQRKAHVERSVERLAEARHPDDEETVDRIVAECGERLDREDYGWILSRPVDEVLADVCQALDLDLDWSLLADMAWVKDEACKDMRPPPLAGEVAQRAGGGTPHAPPQDPCAPPHSPSNAPDGFASP